MLTIILLKHPHISSLLISILYLWLVLANLPYWVILLHLPIGYGGPSRFGSAPLTLHFFPRWCLLNLSLQLPLMGQRFPDVQKSLLTSKVYIQLLSCHLQWKVTKASQPQHS